MKAPTVLNRHSGAFSDNCVTTIYIDVKIVQPWPGSGDGPDGGHPRQAAEDHLHGQLPQPRGLRGLQVSNTGPLLVTSFEYCPLISHCISILAPDWSLRLHVGP